MCPSAKATFPLHKNDSFPRAVVRQPPTIHVGALRRRQLWIWKFHRSVRGHPQVGAAGHNSRHNPTWTRPISPLPSCCRRKAPTRFVGGCLKRTCERGNVGTKRCRAKRCGLASALQHTSLDTCRWYKSPRFLDWETTFPSPTKLRGLASVTPTHLVGPLSSVLVNCSKSPRTF